MQFTQATAALIIAFAAAAQAHSGVSMATGDMGGAMSALGFDESVPQTDPNKNVIEVTANTMPRGGLDPLGNGLGTANNKKKIDMSMMSKAVANGNQGKMPQVKKTMDITYRQMVLDGKFDPNDGAKVYIDETCTGTFKTGAKEAKIISSDPKINAKKATVQGTTVVGQEGNIKVEIPSDVKCAGPNNTCLMRVVNGPNKGVQRWGGHVMFQPADGTTDPAAAAAAGGSPAAVASKKIQARAELEELALKLKAIQVEED